MRYSISLFILVLRRIFRCRELPLIRFKRLIPIRFALRTWIDKCFYQSELVRTFRTGLFYSHKNHSAFTSPKMQFISELLPQPVSPRIIIFGNCFLSLIFSHSSLIIISYLSAITLSSNNLVERFMVYGIHLHIAYFLANNFRRMIPSANPQYVKKYTIFLHKKQAFFVIFDNFLQFV